MATSAEEIAIKSRRADTEATKVVITGLTTALKEDAEFALKKYETDSKNWQASAAAVSRFQAAQQSNSAAEKIRSARELIKLGFLTPERLAKMSSSADRAFIANTQANISSTHPEIAPDQMGREMWREFFLRHSAINPAVLVGTYYQLERDYGPPAAADFSSNPETATAYNNVMEQKARQEALAAQSANQAKVLLDSLDDSALGNEEIAKTQYDNLLKKLPGLGSSDGMKYLDEYVKNPPKMDADLVKKYNDTRDDLMKEVNGGEEAKPVEDNLMARWLSDPYTQEWAKFHNLDVGKVYPLTEQNKADLEAGKIPNGIVTPNGIYAPGPQDRKAMSYAIREGKRSNDKNVLVAAGLANSRRANTPEFIEFDVVRDKSLQHKDGMWYYRTGPDGQKQYLSEEDLQKARNNLMRGHDIIDEARVVQTGMTPSNKLFWVLSDGRTLVRGPEDAAPRLMKEEDKADIAATPENQRGVPKVDKLPEGAPPAPPPALPKLEGIRRTNLPPKSAVETIRLEKDMLLRNRGDKEIQGINVATSRPEAYSADEIVGGSSGVRTVEGGYHKKTPADVVRDIRYGKREKAYKKSLQPEEIGDPAKAGGDFNKQYPGSKATSKATRHRTAEEIKSALPTLPDESLDENLQPVPNTQAFVDDQERINKARASELPGGVRAPNLQGVQQGMEQPHAGVVVPRQESTVLNQEGAQIPGGKVLQPGHEMPPPTKEQEREAGMIDVQPTQAYRAKKEERTAKALEAKPYVDPGRMPEGHTYKSVLDFVRNKKKPVATGTQTEVPTGD